MAKKKFDNHTEFITNTIKDESVFDNVETRTEIKGFKYSGESGGMHIFRKMIPKVPAVKEVKDKDEIVTTKAVPEVPEVNFEMKVMILPKGNRLKVYVYKNKQRIDTFMVDSPHELVEPGTEKE